MQQPEPEPEPDAQWLAEHQPSPVHSRAAPSCAIQEATNVTLGHVTGGDTGQHASARFSWSASAPLVTIQPPNAQNCWTQRGEAEQSRQRRHRHQVRLPCAVRAGAACLLCPPDAGLSVWRVAWQLPVGSAESTTSIRSVMPCECAPLSCRLLVPALLSTAREGACDATGMHAPNTHLRAAMACRPAPSYHHHLSCPCSTAVIRQHPGRSHCTEA